MPTILVVEDEPDLAELLGQVFADAGYTVRDAANGLAALAQLAQGPVDLVLSDVLLPGMDGMLLCQTMQADPQYVHIPVLLMSAHARFALVPHCVPRAIMQKPFNLNTLLNIVAQHIREEAEKGRHDA